MYAIGILIDSHVGLNILKIVPGMLLLYYLPGKNINDIFFSNSKKNISWYVKIPIDIVTSISIIYFSYNLFKNNIEYHRAENIILVIIVNIVAFLLNIFIYKKFKLRSGVDKFHLDRPSLSLILVALIPAVFFLIRIAFNPYVHELDSSQYFHIYNNIIQNSFDTSWLTGQRNGFALYMIFSKYVSNISFFGFIKFFTPVLFFITSMTLFSFTKSIKNKSLSILAYLLILASPYLSIGNEGVRPETFIFIFSFPVFYLIYYAIEGNLLKYSFLALLFSYVAFRFHEFGFFLLVAASVCLLVCLYDSRKLLINKVKENPNLSIIILLPYLLLLKQKFSTLGSIFSAEIFTYATMKIKDLVYHPHWKWWFLDNFTCIDGGTLKWPGYSFILYYLYNGLGIIFISIIIISLFAASKKKIEKEVRAKLLRSLLPIIVFLLLYLIIAEILPRLGLFLLPNRTWPHIMMALIFISILLINKMDKMNVERLNSKFIRISLLIVIIGGVCGTMIGSVFMGGQVLPGEKNVINKIKNLPEKSIIISTQVNENLVEMYGDKTYIPIEQVEFNQKQLFISTAHKAIDDYVVKYKDNIVASYSVNKGENIFISSGNKSKNIILNNEKIINPNLKLDQIRMYDPEEYNNIINLTNKFQDIDKRPVYYVYSFIKFNGILATRDWWIEDNDPKNLNFLKEYSGDDVVYKDKNTILIKISQ